MAPMILRYYQTEAPDAVLDYWANGGGNPLVNMATGTGKSAAIAHLSKTLMSKFPDFRILMLVHVKEIVEQNATALLRAWPRAPIGINSAGIGRRDTWQPILYGSIQSLWRRPEDLGDRDCVIIDEAHLVPKKSAGMYRTLLDALLKVRRDMRVCGFTATPFRLDSGRLDRGPDRLFDKTVYNYGMAQGIEDGYLAPLVPFRMDNEMATNGLTRRGGDFTDAAVAAAADNDAVIAAAAKELVMNGEHRRSWLSFCCGVEHARKIADATRALGIESATITGDTPNTERAQIIAAYKSGRIRHLTNAMVLTTGFDAPQTDLVALFRPTLSPVLYVQCLGRGTRCVGANIEESIANGKADCLVLDFAGNVRRHGPVDTVTVQGSERGLHVTFDEDEERPAVRPDDERAHACTSCGYLGNPPNALRCANCETVLMEEKPKHMATAEVGLAILSSDKDPWEAISDTAFYIHTKPGKPDSLRVEYKVSSRTSLKYKEWIAFEHRGMAREKAVMWWNRMGGSAPVPSTTADALARHGELRVVTSVKVREENGFNCVFARRLDQVRRYSNPLGLLNMPGMLGTSSLPPGRVQW